MEDESLSRRFAAWNWYFRMFYAHAKRRLYLCAQREHASFAGSLTRR